MPDLPPAAHRVASALLVAGLALAGCTGERPTLADEATPRASQTTTTTVAVQEEGDRSQIATAREGEIAVYATPSATEPARTITAAEAVSVPAETPLVFLVKDRSGNRLEVYLPVRPNGSTGWIDSDDVDLSTTEFRILVSLSEHRIEVVEGEEVVLAEPIGVGTQDRPTPGGVYYLKELLQPPEPDGPYGTYAYGLSGFSPVLESFNGGPGVIGLHGTNRPDLVGQDVSSGCIRLTNEAISHLVEDIGLPLGTPVEIEA